MAKSYWNMTIEELLDLCEGREIFFKEKPDQKALVAALFEFDKTHGKLEEVQVEDEDGETVDPSKSGKGEKMIRVMFHSKDEQDLPYVFIGLNGRSYYIPKEQEVIIPKVLITSVIKDAVEVRFIPKKTNDGKIRYDERRVQRYPYTVIDDERL